MSQIINDTIKKQKIEQHISLVQQITDCRSLGEVQSLLNSLISDYGVDAGINFDSGYNNISENIVLLREETDAEYNVRIDKELDSLIKKEKKHQQVSDALTSQIEAFKAAKIQ